MGLIPLGILSSAGGVAFGTYELIESQILGTAAASVTFSGLAAYASTYKHLQLRSTTKTSASISTANVRMRFNSDTGNNYAIHKLFGNGSSVSSIASTSRSSTVGGLAFANATTNAFSGGVCDILDAYSSTKNKTTRLLASTRIDAGTDFIQLVSGVWMNTASITSIELAYEDGGNFVTGSRFSLYGIR
jgi:hypothetical protein